MIVGNGSLSKLLNDREGFIFFAAGVSNSSGIVMPAEFSREYDTLLQFAGDARCLVYFSTISKFIKLTHYTIHKMKMETFVKSWFPNFIILNVGNIYEDTNPNTFLNYIKAKQASGEPVEIRGQEIKYMISRAQLNFITDNLPSTGKHEISIFGEIKHVHELL